MAYSVLLVSGVIGMVNPVMAESQIPEARVMNQKPIQMGNYQVYFSAFNSTFVPPGIAEQYNLRRGGRYGIVNIAIRDVSSDELGTAVTGKVSGHTMNLLTQKSSLKFSEVKEGSAIYYLADFTFSDEELLKFAIDVKPQGSARSETLRFEQTFYH
ncbi:DUF4426 domain-containing protein [Endozoicomonas sp. SCSIO W0465]|uniref:DUF4426 domain-containing protein n=1 Tax=Endozoicomonas sp. SCSIO W0465 TaxID=2918516 RepID=UPI0020756865|nr:DUF4426 domain-containing protein [Endozoicomonas sp. SCSIO W0465]USE36544.1 DUF4426 domain-containing protein [Endozoicomonas sp. SCSIO W0465]